MVFFTCAVLSIRAPGSGILYLCNAVDKFFGVGLGHLSTASGISDPWARLTRSIARPPFQFRAYFLNIFTSLLTSPSDSVSFHPCCLYAQRLGTTLFHEFHMT